MHTLHIISSSVPSPPDFGGAIDVFYKLKALNETGVKIILHCFEYGRPKADELKNYCDEVYYYPRKTGLPSLLSTTPYIVKSRQNQELLKRLQNSRHPILFEGLHTTSYLGHPALNNCKQWVRAHNVEHDYYNSLFKAEGFTHRKIYYKLEAWKLERFNYHLGSAAGVLAISASDAEALKSVNKNTILIPAFHGYSAITSLTGKGEYVLYHGDLSVAENHRAAEFVTGICRNLPHKLIIAGKMPQNSLRSAINHCKNTELIENPDADTMANLIRNAGAILLPARQTTGLRLKLLASLFTGRHCIASPEMVKYTGLEKLCRIASSRDEWQQTVKLCMTTPFTAQHIEQRREPLKTFLDIENAKKIVQLIF
ncbi:MAG: hypothetical protein LBV41_05805 [Cytophagaceae bacterium]|jgi:glycosyltransferase involved in cell wall biosynthesis|nr:hypothetical protein [Cytophagaceae bacterium]